MHFIGREDLLETVFHMTNGGGTTINVRELSLRLAISLSEAQTLCTSLASDGMLNPARDGNYVLSEQGLLSAGKIVKKHRILEQFFIEMLGIHPREASEEACRLEHHVSDEMTSRLSEYIGESPSGKGGRKRRKGWQKESTLLDFQEGDIVEIKMVGHRSHLHRLMDLGFIPGERAVIRRKLPNNALLIEIKGCDIALSPNVAAMIHAEKAR